MLSDPVFTHLETASRDPASVEDTTLSEAVARWGIRLVDLAIHAMWEFGDIDTPSRDRLSRTLDHLDTETADSDGLTAESPVSSLGLEQVLHDAIRSSDAKAQGPGRVALESAMAFLLQQDPTSLSWHYLQGLLEGGDLPSEIEWATDNPDFSRQLGRLERLSIQDPAAWRSVVSVMPTEVTERVARMREAHRLVGALVDNCCDQAARVRTLVDLTPVPFDGWTSVMDRAIAQGNRAHSPEEVVEVEALIVALANAMDRWALAGHPDVARAAEAPLLIARARCRRMRNDFAGARRFLSRLDDSTVPSQLRAAVALERALAVAEIRSPRSVRFPRVEGDMARLVHRLGPARTDLLSVLDAEPDNAFAHLLLGALLHCEEDPAAATHLSVAVAAFEQDPEVDPDLVAELRFVTGLAHLRLLEPGTANGAYSLISSALASDYRPRPDDIVSAVHALEAHDSPHVGDFLGRVRNLLPREPNSLRVVTDRARKGDLDCLELVEDLAAHRRLTLANRVALLDAALVGTQAVGDVDRARRIVYSLDDALMRMARSDLDAEFADCLATLDVVRTALGHTADGLRIEVLRRIGRLDDARELARQMFFRAVAGSLPPEFDALDFLLLLAELGLPEEEVEKLQRLVPTTIRDPDAPKPLLSRPLRVVFVGGDETQQRYLPSVEQELQGRFGNHLGVDWFLTGWRSNWRTDLDRIVTAFNKAAAVVIMTFVRTQLGETVRRRAGEHGLPWVACTGHGRDSIVRALDRATRLAAARSQPEEGRSAR